MARPHRPILSRQLIATAALELVDSTGRFTVPELAHKLGVSVSSLYHHVGGRADIVEGVRGLLTRPLTELPPADHWQQAVRAWATAYRDGFAAHPAAIPMLVGQTVSNPETLGQYDRLAQILEEQAGLTGDALLVAITMLDNLCLGAALDLAAPSEVWTADGRDTALTRALAAAPDPDRERSRRTFERQLELIITSLEVELTPRT
jgi:AcrR family transcriptional regulator